MAESHPAVPVLLTPYGGPENTFGLTPVQVDNGRSRAAMPSGRWLTDDDGRPAAGALAVLLDVAWGQSIILHRHPDHFTVTTELSVDFCAPLPLDGRTIHAESHIVAHDDAGGLSSGRAFDDSGVTIALGTTWHLFTPAVPTPTAATTTATPPSATSLGALLDLHPAPSGKIVIPPDPRYANPLGVLHGGILAAVCEISARTAIDSPGLATAALRVRYHRPGTGAVTFTPQARHVGRRFAAVDVEARDADNRTCGSATVTFRSTRR